MKLKFRIWEVLLLTFATLLFVICSYFYFTEIPLRVLLLGMKAQGTYRKMGEVGTLSGSVKRKAQDRQDFQNLKNQGELYDSDTIVTGPDSLVQIKLDDGGVIDLGPQTMIRLVFSAYVSFNGISRSTGVEVVTGQVKGSAKDREIILKTTTGESIRIDKDSAPQAVAIAVPLPGKAPTLKVIKEIAVIKPSPSPTPKPSPTPVPKPSPSPSPSPTPKPSPSSLQAAAMTIPDGTQPIKLGPGTAQPVLEVPFVFKLSSQKTKAKLTIKKGNQILLDQPLSTASDGRASVKVRMDQPGDFSWSVTEINPKAKKELPPLLLGKFTVAPEYRAMFAPEVLISGKKIISTRGFLKDQKFALDLKWKPYPTAKEYLVRIFRSDKDVKPWIEERVKTTEWHKPMKEPFYGSVAVKLSTLTEKGFWVTAQPTVARYDFASPIVVEPGPVFHLDSKKIAQNGIKILCSWSRTEFTQSYDFEIATDEKFEKIVLKKNVGDNFFIITKIANGKYWWRLRSIGKGISSAYTEPRIIFVGE